MTTRNARLPMLALMVLLAIPSLLCLSKEKLFEDSPITKWPNITYDAAYQGASHNFSQEPEKIAALLATTLNISTRDQAKAEGLNEEMCVILGWFYALYRSRTTLLAKPFESWTITDIKNLSSWLTRLDPEVSEPGAFRVDEATWQIREEICTKEWSYIVFLLKRKEVTATPQSLEKFRNSLEVQKFPTLLNPLTDEEKALLKNSIYLFTPIETIEKELQAALEEAQNAVIAIKNLPWQERQNKVLSISSKFHYDIVRVHPFQEGSKRLGRLCLYLINAQHGIRPVHFTDAIRHKSALVACLKRNSHAPFESFIRACYGLEHEQEEREPVATSTWCHFCGNRGEDLKICSGCKKFYYCNKDCQKQDWNAGHKQECAQQKAK